MKFRKWNYYIEEAAKSIIRNGLMSLSSIVTVVACIFILTFSYCVAVNVDYALTYIEKTVGITVSIRDNCTGEEVTLLYEKITSLENVESVTFISAEEGLVKLAESLGQSEFILDAYKLDNPIPRSFDIKLKNTKSQSQIVDILSSASFKAAGVETVRHALEVAEILSNINSAVRIVSVVLLAVMMFLSVVIIINTIKITVNSRRNEISIMRYVGATKWFIRWPFIVEGILIGVLGAVIPVTVCWFGYSYAVESLVSSIGLIKNLFEFKTSVEIFPYFSPFAVVLGAFIGAAGSFMSVRKYLNV